MCLIILCCDVFLIDDNDFMMKSKNVLLSKVEFEVLLEFCY